jgi:hypothetical protein
VYPGGMIRVYIQVCDYVWFSMCHYDLPSLGVIGCMVPSVHHKLASSVHHEAGEKLFVLGTSTPAPEPRLRVLVSTWGSFSNSKQAASFLRLTSGGMADKDFEL